MKILVLNGSPHRFGNTMALVNAFREGAEEAGHTVNVLNAYDLDINGCIACEYCHTKGEGACIIQDDMQEVYPLMQEMDMLVVASPIYYFNITGPLQTMITRIYCIAAFEDRFKNATKCALLLTSESPTVYTAAEVSFKENFVDYLGLEHMGVFKTDDSNHKSPEMIEKVRAFGASL